ncbi:MAG: hypothetical protein KGL39_29205 [Patescibacteria group bacterium]|nr:hypothetical protein [Patescibacteria group bacterium]
MPIWAFLFAGIASWFQPDAIYGSMHVCASNAIPISTHIEIVNADNHHQTDCLIIGTGPFVPGRVLDVSPSVRDQLGFDGLANVRVYETVGSMQRCVSNPSPATCKTPPRACVLDIPKPVLVRC